MALRRSGSDAHNTNGAAIGRAFGCETISDVARLRVPLVRSPAVTSLPTQTPGFPQLLRFDSMDDVTSWIEARRREWERRFDRLEAILEERQGER